MTKGEAISSWASNFFLNSYKEQHSVTNREDRKWVIDSTPNVIMIEENFDLIQLVTKEEVHRAIFSMKAYKTMGLDGFPQPSSNISRM